MFHLLTDPDLPRPNISISHSSINVEKSNVTIQCWGKGPSKRFSLHQDGGDRTLRSLNPDGNTATFIISNITQKHGGIYRCSYTPPSGFLISSEPSDAVELFVLGEDPNPVCTPHYDFKNLGGVDFCYTFDLQFDLDLAY